MSDERELKELYQAMRREDARHAPSFARLLQRPRAADAGYLRAVAIAVALVLVAVVASVSALRRRDVPAPVAQSPAVHVPTPAVAPAPVVAATPKAAPPAAARRRRQAAPSIDDWKSPTDAWLQTPDESFRNSLPSLQYSSVQSE